MDGVSVGGGGGGGGRPLAGWLVVWLDWLIGSACGGQRLLGRATDGWVRDGRWWRGLLLGVADMPSMDVKLGRDCPGACGAAVVARSSRHVFFSCSRVSPCASGAARAQAPAQPTSPRPWERHHLRAESPGAAQPSPAQCGAAQWAPPAPHRTELLAPARALHWPRPSPLNWIEAHGTPPGLAGGARGGLVVWTPLCSGLQQREMVAPLSASRCSSSQRGRTLAVTFLVTFLGGSRVPR